MKQLWKWSAEVLGNYRATEVEIACDLRVSKNKSASEQLFWLVSHIRKRWHKRGHLRSVQKAGELPRAGCSTEPTIYFERRKAGTNLKCYLRSQKIAGGGFGAECLRIEWTLKRGRALTRHLGGNQIENLATADLGEFVRRNLRFELVDHVAFGLLFNINGRPIIDDGRAKRAAYQVLRRLAYREEDKFPDFGYALEVCQNSPAQVRGFLRELQKKDRAPKRGRPKRGTRRRRDTITDYRIERCFVALKPLLGGNNYTCQPKTTDYNRINNNGLPQINHARR